MATKKTNPKRKKAAGVQWKWTGRDGIVMRAFKFAATVGVWSVVAGFCFIAFYALDLPDVKDAAGTTRRPTITMLDKSGAVFATRGDLYGQAVKVSELPKALPQAVLATEDRRFYSHFGLDPIGIARAAFANIRAGRIVQGGSTLTQQAAKNLFLTPERSFKRKVQEVLLAFWLEAKFSKDQILTMYLNRVYLGAGTYGVDAAAHRYFGKAAKDVSLYEAALLAGLLKAPSRYNPLASPDAADGRTRQVLKNMVVTGYITEKQADTATKHPSRRYRPPATDGRYFADWVLGRIDDYVTMGETDLVVATTFDPAMQRAAERHTLAALAQGGTKAKVGQVALVAMAPDGAVRAMVGGVSHAESSFNRATQAERQPGSAFKPFVYLAALEAGMTPSTRVEDAPLDIDGWKPGNFDDKYLGSLTLARALAVSSNTAAVRVAQKAGFKRVAETAGRLGIPGEIKPRPSLALGAHEVKLIDLVAAYAPFAAAGRAAWPYAIKEIKNAKGGVLYRRQGSGPGRVVGSAEVAEMNAMLAGVIQGGTGHAAKLGRPAAGKTGTSQNHRDAWFVGYTADLVAGVWVGNDDGAPMARVTGGGMPARIWGRFMEDAHNGIAVHALPGVDGAPMPDQGGGSFVARDDTPVPEKNFMDRFMDWVQSAR
jgi:penicillin-binding protein 1A